MKNKSTLIKVLYVIGAVAFLFGLWGFYIRFFVGERAANYGSYIVWGLWVAMYLFFAGIAAGAYMIACLDYLFEIKLFKGTGKVALLGALVTLPAGLITIGMDLGHMERIWKVFLQPDFGSIMAQMVWGYSVFFVIIILSLWTVFQKPAAKWSKPLFGIGLFMTIFLSGGVGAFLGVNASRAYWHVGLLPAQFPFFSLASGVALMLIFVGWLAPKEDKKPNLLWSLALMSVVLGLIKLFFLWADFSQSLYSGVPDNIRAVNSILFGEFWWIFWFIQIGLGTLVPIIVLLQPKFGKNPKWAGAMGVLILIGFGIARVNIILPALAVPEFEGLSSAFQGPHLSLSYFPSLMEWLVLSGVIGLAILAFLIISDRVSIWPGNPTLNSKSEVEE